MIKFVIVVLTLFCPVAFSVKHSFKIFLTATSGVPDLAEFVGYLLVDGVQVAYYDSNKGRTEPKVNWARKFLEDNPQHLHYYVQECKKQREFLSASIHSLMKRLNHTGGAHIKQQVHGCEWDDETGEIRGFNKFGYDGEDFIELDMQTLTWTASIPQAFIFKQRWDADETMLKNNRNYHLHIFPGWLQKYVRYGRIFLQRTDLPSVSLLQKTPSSLVTCHATGFYPDRADLFWRKDGVELHEDVDRGEILPNHDGTFQMSVDLNISSIAPGDWKKYDCVFQMSGVKDDVITKLDKSVIRTNPRNPLTMIIPIVVVAVVVLAVIAVVGFIVYKKNKNKCPPSPAENREVQEEMLPRA